jgi:hypothetical protein
MTTKGAVAIAGVFIAGCMIGGATSGVLERSARASGSQRWEYNCLATFRGITDASNKLGELGWEMVAGAGTAPGNGMGVPEYVFCFKRPKS